MSRYINIFGTGLTVFLMLVISFSSASSQTTQKYQYQIKFSIKGSNIPGLQAVDYTCNLFSERAKGGKLVARIQKPKVITGANFSAPVIVDFTTNKPAKSYSCIVNKITIQMKNPTPQPGQSRNIMLTIPGSYNGVTLPFGLGDLIDLNKATLLATGDI